MGDLIMSGPAIRALKQTFGAHITILTSSMAQPIVTHMPEIDEAIIYDLPWVKTAADPNVSQFNEVIDTIRKGNFDAAVVFTVYSQNPLPTAMLAYLAGVPHILAYCRENPYQLVTHWVPDKEPYEVIKHQVRRDLDLVATIGATTSNEALKLTYQEADWPAVNTKLSAQGVDVDKSWIIMHAGVSEAKRKYPTAYWVSAAKMLIRHKNCQILFTGSTSESSLTAELTKLTGEGSFSVGGSFNINEMIGLIKNTKVMVSVNTGVVHIAAAMQTPIVVLYAQTNPQHTPWGVPAKVLPFAVPLHLRSQNEVIAHVNKTHYSKPVALPSTEDVVAAVIELIKI